MIETIHWHTLHPRFLGPQSVVVDLGANYGRFTEAVVKRFGCRCLAVEPSPEPFAAIKTNGLITKLQAAVAGKSGMMPFHISTHSVASSLGEINDLVATIQVRVLTLPDILIHVGGSKIDLLKVDIEGAEIDMLAACSDEFLAERVAQMAIEFHDFCGLTPAKIVGETLGRLRRLDFQDVRMSRVGHQDTWLINRNLLDISDAELWFTTHVVRYWNGFKRVIGREVLDRFR